MSPSYSLLTKRGGCHFSVTAAAIGVRMVPRAVAASSSISVFSRLITHSMASLPCSRTKPNVIQANRLHKKGKQDGRMRKGSIWVKNCASFMIHFLKTCT